MRKISRSPLVKRLWSPLSSLQIRLFNIIHVRLLPLITFKHILARSFERSFGIIFPKIDVKDQPITHCSTCTRSLYTLLREQNVRSLSNNKNVYTQSSWAKRANNASFWVARHQRQCHSHLANTTTKTASNGRAEEHICLHSMLTLTHSHIIQ